MLHDKFHNYIGDISVQFRVFISQRIIKHFHKLSILNFSEISHFSKKSHHEQHFIFLL